MPAAALAGHLRQSDGRAALTSVSHGRRKDSSARGVPTNLEFRLRSTVAPLRSSSSIRPPSIRQTKPTWSRQAAPCHTCTPNNARAHQFLASARLAHRLITNRPASQWKRLHLRTCIPGSGRPGSIILRPAAQPAISVAIGSARTAASAAGYAAVTTELVGAQVAFAWFQLESLTEGTST